MSKTPEPRQEILHATTVSIDGKGVLIVGPSGAGKSAMALEMMAMGAELVADDRTIVTRNGNTLQATVPEAISGKIEARGVGILTVPRSVSANLVLVVDLSQTSNSRLPEAQHHDVVGVQLTCLYRYPGTHFAASVFFYIKGLSS
jgi:HPr kinase/phosphorylase